jgi:type IV pilus assembly protein PilC
MSDYTYVGVDKTGKRISGKVEAPSDGELRMQLRTQGIRPTQIFKNPLAGEKKRSIFQKDISKASVPLEHLLIFTRQLFVLVSSGIPLVQSIETLADQQVHPDLKQILTEVKDKVASGSYLWESLSQYPGAFSKLYVSLMRAGESSGAMDEMLRRLTQYMEDADRLRKMIKSAMIYPVLVITVSIGVIAVMMIFVIPKFEELLAGSGQKLPEFTQLVIDMSRWTVAHIYHLVGGTIIFGYLFMRFIKTPEGRGIMDRLTMRLPVFGQIAQKGAIARFTRTMNTLLASGVSLLDAIDICKATLDNAVIEDAVAKIRADVEQGNRFATVVGKIPLFPRMAVQMIAVGESSGQLDQMLEKIADFYEAEVEALVGGISKMIEPFIIVFLGGIVGSLLIAMYLPVFKMADGMN